MQTQTVLGEGHASPTPPRVRFERTDLLLATADNLRKQARLAQAEAILRDLDARRPDDVAVLMGLASVRQAIGDADESIAIFDRARALDPDNLSLLSGAIFSYDRRSEATLEDSYRLRREFNDRVKRPVRPHLNTRAPNRPLRIGYVSGDFRNHSAALVWGACIVSHHAPDFEVYAYATHVRGDWLTDTLHTAIPNWRDVADWSDERLEQQIREDQIDILVDLSGHSAGNRLLLFARKPAPIQVTAWGYITGTGLDAVDYLFADRDTVLAGEERWYAETIYYLPRIVSYWAAAPDVVGPVAPLPALANGHLTFGVFNRLGKIRRESIELWSRLLDRLPTARLILKVQGLDDESTRTYLQSVFSDAGCDLSRLQFRGSTDHTTHMQAYNEVDVCLDPWPDGGGVSTLEALWMGVPALTLPHRQIASRLTTSFNRELGLPFFVAYSKQELIERAVALNDQWQGLAAVRADLRDVMSCSILCDHESYVTWVERAYRDMWQRWCRGEPSKPSLPTTPARMVSDGVVPTDDLRNGHAEPAPERPLVVVGA